MDCCDISLPLCIGLVGRLRFYGKRCIHIVVRNKSLILLRISLSTGETDHMVLNITIYTLTIHVRQMRKIHLRIAYKLTLIISFWIFSVLHWTAENVHTSVWLHIFKYLCILNLCFYSIFKVPIASFKICIYIWRCNMNRINPLQLCDDFKEHGCLSILPN